MTPFSLLPFSLQSSTITDAKGVHDLYLIFVGDNGPLSLDWWQFE